MRIEFEFWQLMLLLIAFLGCVAGFGKVLLDQFERRLSERFSSLDKAREQGQGAMRQAFEVHLTEERRNADAVANLERDFLHWQANLPLNYVRRDDYVRGQSVLEAKLDALYSRLEYVQLKREKQHE